MAAPCSLNWCLEYGVHFRGRTAPAPQVYSLVLQAVGRTPNGKTALPPSGITSAGIANQGTLANGSQISLRRMNQGVKGAL